MFGNYEIEDKFLIRENTLEIRILKIAKRIFKYYRKCRNTEEFKRIVAEKINLGIYPLPPLNQKYFTTNTLYLKLRSAIALPPKERIIVYFKAPVDVGVALYKNNIFTILDKIPLIKEKYAIYGSIENGQICRFYTTDVYYKEPQVLLGEALVEAEINNLSNDFIEISKIIMPVAGVNMFYRGKESHYGLFKIVIESLSSISIKYVKEAKIPYFHQSPITVGQFKEHFRLEWGVS